MEFLTQDIDFSCFVVAAANLAIFLGIEVKDLEVAKNIARCKNGATICKEEVLCYLGVEHTYGFKLVKLEDDNWLTKTKPGIITINHPIFNFHSVFSFPENGKITLVNSWLGPHVMSIDYNTLEKFFPEHAYQRIGYFLF
jgi:hypothetical protein